MPRGPVEHVLAVTAEVDTLDEALQFAVQELDRHRFKPGTYLIEIVSATDEGEAGDDVYFEVSVQGNLDQPEDVVSG
jgi:hypothetical protein